MKRDTDTMPKKLIAAVACITLFTTACSSIKDTQPSGPNPDAKSLSATFHNSSPSFDVLFVSAAYNETITFQALMSELHKRGYSAKIVTFNSNEKTTGKKSKDIFNLKQHLEQSQLAVSIDDKTPEGSNHYNNIGYSFTPNNWLENPVEPIAQEQVQIITQSLNPKLVITGISHVVQAQIANQFQAQNVPVVAMYNKLIPFDNQPGVQRWLKDAKPVDEIFIPVDILIEATHKLRPFQSSWITVTGMPALPRWKESVKTSNQKAVRRALNLNREKPTIVFLGKYDQYYANDLDLLLQAMRERPDIQVVIQNAGDTALTNSILARYKGLEHVRLVSRQWPGTSLVAIADMIVTNDSYDGTMAALAQYPVLFISDTQKHPNALVDLGLAASTNKWAGLLNAVHKVIDKNVHASGSVSPMGFPKRPIERTTNRIEAIMQRTANPLKSVTIEKIEMANSM